MVKIAHGEERYSHTFIMSDAMNKQEGRSKTVPEFARNGIHHLSHVVLQGNCFSAK
jgi:hypothetical protein